MASPEDRRYTPTHEWHKPEGGLVVLGLSQFAVAELTDITFVEFKKKSGPVRKGEAIGEIESVKATSEIYSGIDGAIVAVNPAVVENPALVNQDPYGAGWLVKIQPTAPQQVEGLLSAKDYDASHG